LSFIRDIRQLCKRLRTDGIKAITRCFSGGKQVNKSANGEIAVGIVYPRQREDDNVKIWMEMIIVKYFLMQ